MVSLPDNPDSARVGIYEAFFVVQREDGVYEALSPTGGNMYYKEGNTRVTGQSFAETVRKAEEYMRQPELRSSHASVFGI